MDSSALGKRINSLRRERGLTSAVVSEMCDIQQVFLQQIEGGKRTPSLKVFVRICNALDVSPDCLLADSLMLKEQDVLSRLQRQIERLTPSQMEVASSTVSAMIKYLK